MDHKELNVWKKSMDLVTAIYDLSSAFPDDERFGLTSQIRRSAVSIPSNIAEGAARKGDKELTQFIYIALGSLAELETQYLIAVELKFTPKSKELDSLLIDVKKLLLGFKNYIQNKK